MAKETPKYTTIIHKIRIELDLSCNEYCVADIIFFLSNNPDAKVLGWCFATKETIAGFLGMSKQTIHEIINRLIEKKLIEKDPESKYLKTTSLWYQSVILERLKMKNITSKETLPIVKKGDYDSKETLLGIVKKGDSYIYNDNNIDIVTKGLPSQTRPKRNEIAFKRNDYDKVLKSYQSLRGIVLQGREFEPVQQAIKTMFISNRSADDIIGCMEWLASGSEEWMENWTINTVKLKIPFYLKGRGENKLKVLKL